MSEQNEDNSQLIGEIKEELKKVRKLTNFGDLTRFSPFVEKLNHQELDFQVSSQINARLYHFKANGAAIDKIQFKPILKLAPEQISNLKINNIINNLKEKVTNIINYCNENPKDVSYIFTCFFPAVYGGYNTITRQNSFLEFFKVFKSNTSSDDLIYQLILGYSLWDFSFLINFNKFLSDYKDLESDEVRDIGIPNLTLRIFLKALGFSSNGLQKIIAEYDYNDNSKRIKIIHYLTVNLVNILSNGKPTDYTIFTRKLGGQLAGDFAYLENLDLTLDYKLDYKFYMNASIVFENPVLSKICFSQYDEYLYNIFAKSTKERTIKEKLIPEMKATFYLLKSKDEFLRNSSKQKYSQTWENIHRESTEKKEEFLQLIKELHYSTSNIHSKNIDLDGNYYITKDTAKDANTLKTIKLVLSDQSRFLSAQNPDHQTILLVLPQISSLKGMIKVYSGRILKIDNLQSCCDKFHDEYKKQMQK